jgi:hypothetical protein
MPVETPRDFLNLMARYGQCTLGEVLDALAAAEQRADLAEAEAREAHAHETRLNTLQEATQGLLDLAEKRAAEAEAERDALQRHFDAAAPEHNLLALLDLYHERECAAEQEVGRLRGKCVECGAETVPVCKRCGE